MHYNKNRFGFNAMLNLAFELWNDIHRKYGEAYQLPNFPK